MFYLDLFKTLEGINPSSATEVVERVNENIQGVAPVVSRLQSELYSPVIRRVVNLLGDNGKIDAPPEGYGDEVFSSVEYTTRLDAKLADVETNQLVRSIEQAALVAAKAIEIPTLKYILKVDDAIRQIFHNNRVDPDLLFSEKEAEERQTADEAAQAQAQAAQMMADKVKPIDTQKNSEEGSPIEDMGDLEGLGGIT